MKHPWMPIFWGDFFANTLHLTAQEIGAYLCLIAHIWENGGTITADSHRLRRIARVTAAHWPKVWKTLKPFFEIEGEGDPIRVTHVRVLRELAKADGISKQRKIAAQQMHSKHKLAPTLPHMREHMQNVGNHQESIDPSFFPTAARKGKQNSPPRSLATALPTGALVRSAEIEDEARKRVAEKAPEDRTLADINLLRYGKP